MCSLLIVNNVTFCSHYPPQVICSRFCIITIPIETVVYVGVFQAKKKLDSFGFQCYTTDRLTKQVQCIVETQCKTPSSWFLLGVSSAFTEQSTEVHYRYLLLSVQPFAYVMADYTCHNRKNPRSKYFHSGNTSFLSQNCARSER